MTREIEKIQSNELPTVTEEEFGIVLKRALWPPIFLTLGLLCILAALIIHYQATTRWVENANRVISQGYLIQKLIVDMESGLRGYLIVGEKDFLVPYEQSASKIDSQFKTLRGLVGGNPTQKARLQVIEDRFQVWNQYAQEVIGLRSASKGIEMVRSRMGKVRMDAIRKEMSAFIGEEEKLRFDRSLQSRNLGIIAAISIIGIFILSVVFLFFFTRKHFGELLSTYEKALKQLARQTEDLKRAKADLEIRISERTEALISANKDLQIFRILVQTVKDYAIYMIDPSGVILTWNLGAERIQGYSAQEVIGQNFSQFYTRKDQLSGHPQEELRQALSYGVYEEEGVRIRKDGSKIWANVILTPMFDDHQKHLGFAKVVRDISEKRQAQEKLQQAFNELKVKSEDLESVNQASQRKGLELQAANQELEAFCYSVSHDLRSPLRGISGFAQALQEDYGEKLEERGKRYIERIRAGAQRMGTLIDDLLNLSRLTRAQMKVVPIDLSDLSMQVIHELQSSDPGRKVQIYIEPGLKSQGDPGLMKAALDNLLRNAWKFTSKKENPSIEVQSQIQGTQRVYYVKDNGAGFDMAYSNKLFGAFQRLHAADEFPGSGIGLATVRRIIHRHGGRVWVEAKEGYGATFYFTLNEPSILKSDMSAA